MTNRNHHGTRIVYMSMKTLLAALLCTLLAGCAAPLPSVSPTGSSPNPSLHVSNGTALTVTVVVNGQHVGDYAPGGPDAAINVAALPPLPWNVEARSPSGRVLVSLPVDAGDGQGETSVGQFADLSCGRLWLWAGDVTPDAPRPSPYGKPGDCAP